MLVCLCFFTVPYIGAVKLEFLRPVLSSVLHCGSVLCSFNPLARDKVGKLTALATFRYNRQESFQNLGLYLHIICHV
jgi:hypothetical protein